MNILNLPLFSKCPLWEAVPEYELPNAMWESENPFRPRCAVKLCAVNGSGFYAHVTALEHNPTAVYFKRDDPVWLDSCLELFIRPFADDPRYINLEMNPNCAFLSEIGSSRNDRVLLSALSKKSCCVSKLDVSGGWGVEAFIPFALVSDCFNRCFSVEHGQSVYGNVYKCADNAERPHYLSLFFVNTPEPDFHRPEFFGKYIFNSEGENCK